MKIIHEQSYCRGRREDNSNGLFYSTFRRNEVLDDKAVIRKLKQRVAELENEVFLLKQSTSLPPSREVRMAETYSIHVDAVIY